MFSVAKAKRQQQSAQSERKSATRFGEEPFLCILLHFKGIEILKILLFKVN
ncbi:hypothetical protein [Lysinibacillus sp. fls2-241-R2A-57]|uniref:hypothetical protein n=1 Tax=Lysinibacillus sp. fls2-241-R2A-57 TaxID=3040292 RepID=UPI00255433FF|nr:hypothetical protein [Lysinibacillus sp. fls2-241-R2A-57]